MNLMEDNSGFIRKLFLLNVWPGVTSQIVSTVGSIVCTSIAGILFGKIGLAVIGLFSPFFFLAGFFGTIIANGSAAIAATYLAKDDSERVAGIYTLAMALSVALASFMWLVMFLLRQPVILLLSGDGELLELASLYYEPTLWYAFFTVVVYMPISWSRLMGKSFVPLILTITMSGAGAALGAFYTFALGRGLESLASAQAQATAIALVIALVLLHRPHYDRFILKKPQYILEDSKAIILAGSPLGLSRLYRFANTLALNAIFLRWVGTAAVAMLGVLNVLLRFFTAISNGITGVQMPIAGVLHEERDRTSLKQLAHSVFSCGNAITLSAVISIIVFRQNIASFFGTDQNALTPALICFAIYVLIYSNVHLYIAWLTSLRFIAQANVLAFMQDMFFPSLFALLLALANSYVQIWLYLPLAGVASALFLLLIVGFTRRRHSGLSYPLMINSHSNETALSFSVECNVKKASEASEAVNDFCIDHGLDGRRSMLIALAIEEIIALIAIQSNDDNKQRGISVRITILNSDVVLRLRVGGRKFNPIQYYQDRLKINENFVDNVDLIGIKFIVDTSKKVYYRATFGVNNMVIII